MKINIERTEPSTGGESRTPRERMEPVFLESDEVEPDALLDASTSEGWPLDSGAPPVWGTQMSAFRLFVAAAQDLDSQAKAEQAGGSAEKGGIYSVFFNHGVVPIGEGDDDGDLNTENMDEKVSAIRVRDENGNQVPLPWGGTNVMEAVDYLDRHYLLEFARDEQGALVPVTGRPKRARTLWTDGAMKDFRDFGHRLESSQADIGQALVRRYKELDDVVTTAGELWPQEEWFVAIFGEGEAHNATLALYNQIAEKHTNVHVISFELVTNPAEIAEDMAFSVLSKK